MRQQNNMQLVKYYWRLLYGLLKPETNAVYLFKDKSRAV